MKLCPRRSDLLKLEELLRYFHVTCASAVADLNPKERSAFSASVACVAADAFIACKRSEYLKETLLQATKKYWCDVAERLAAKIPPGQCPVAEQAWLNFAAVAEPKAKASPAGKKAANAAAAVAERLLPRVILYDDATDAPMGEQDTREEEEKESAVALVRVPWKEWMASEVAQNLDEAASLGAAATLVLRSLHHKGNVHMQDIDVKLNLETKQKTVVAVAELKPDTLQLPPCTPVACGKVFTTSSHPLRVAIGISQRVERQGPTPAKRSNRKTSQKDPAESAIVKHTYYVHPEYKLPADATPDDAVASGVSPGTRAWEWKGDETLHPFWAVQRLTADELSKRNFREKTDREFNIALIEKDFNVVTVGSLGGQSVSMTTTVTVPIMTNTKAVAPGAELLMEIAPKIAVAKRKAPNWKDDVASAAKAKANAVKSAAKPKPKPSSPLEIGPEV